MEDLTIIAEAIDRGDYAKALNHLKVFCQANPEDPWGKFYLGRLQEAQHRLREAETIYIQVLKQTTQVKLINLARQGIQRVQAQEQQEHQEAIEAALAGEGQQEMSCLVLEPIDNAQKAQVMGEFGRLMHLDPYTARLHLPSRIWRLYRTGPLGELTVYQQSLVRIGVPAFCIALSTIESVPVLSIQSLQITGKKLIVQIQNSQAQNTQAQSETIALDSSEIQQWVEGLLPLFEQVVDQGPWRKVIHKEKIQDYAHLIDLHCPERGVILRLCDRNYEFPSQTEGHSKSAKQRPKTSLENLTHHQRWHTIVSSLMDFLPHLSKRSTFQLFAEAAFDQDLFLQRISPHIDLLRQEDSPWDPAFHLYSILHWVSRNLN
jgi:hypothetical protein